MYPSTQSTGLGRYPSTSPGLGQAPNTAAAYGGLVAISLFPAILVGGLVTLAGASWPWAVGAGVAAGVATGAVLVGVANG